VQPQSAAAETAIPVREKRNFAGKPLRGPMIKVEISLHEPSRIGNRRIGNAFRVADILGKCHIVPDLC
jgi:hypothetical protein